MVVSPNSAKQMTQDKPEHEGSFLTHPYVLYIALTAGLFGLLLLLAWIGLKSGWVAGSGG